MQIKETISVSFPGSVESPPLQDVVVLADSAGVALGVQRAFSARVLNADPEELYFALLSLCRNAVDAMPHGGTITVAARNVEPSAGAVRGFVEIVVADD